MCDICGVMWRRSQLERKADGLLYCPDDRDGRDPVTLARLQAERAKETRAPLPPSDGRMYARGYTAIENIPIPGVLDPISITLVSPTNGEQLYSGVSVAFVAEVDTPGELEWVRFYANEALVAEVNEEPHAYSWQPPGPGQWVLRAEARNSSGATAKSGQVELLVDELPASPLAVNAQVWLDTLDGATLDEQGKVLSWSNRGTQEFSIAIDTDERRPVESMLRGRRAWFLQGQNNQRLQIDTLPVALSAPLHVFWVAALESPSTTIPIASAVSSPRFHVLQGSPNRYPRSLQIHGGITSSITATSVVPYRGWPMMVYGRFDGANSVIRLNGEQVAAGAVGSNDWSGLHYGGSAADANHDLGLMGDVIIVQGALSATEIENIEDYLLKKFAINQPLVRATVIGDNNAMGQGTASGKDSWRKLLWQRWLGPSRLSGHWVTFAGGQWGEYPTDRAHLEFSCTHAMCLEGGSEDITAAFGAGTENPDVSVWVVALGVYDARELSGAYEGTVERHAQLLDLIWSIEPNAAIVPVTATPVGSGAATSVHQNIAHFNAGVREVWDELVAAGKPVFPFDAHAAVGGEWSPDLFSDTYLLNDAGHEVFSQGILVPFAKALRAVV